MVYSCERDYEVKLSPMRNPNRYEGYDTPLGRLSSDCVPPLNSATNVCWYTTRFSKQRLIARHTSLHHKQRSPSAACLLFHEQGEIMTP